MKKILYIIFSFLVVATSVAQNRHQLERKRKRLNKDIRKIEKILKKTKNKRTNALDDLKEYNDKVTVREKLIQTIELEIEQLSNEITSNQYTIRKNQDELKILKADYSKMLYKSYKSKSKQSKAMFIMSSEDFNQAFKRLKYINEYKDFRKSQGISIIEKTKIIEQLNDSLKVIKLKKLKLLSEKEDEKDKINIDIKNQQQLVSKIKKEERKYRRNLQRKLDEDRRISIKIRKALAEAIRKANKERKSKSKELVLTAKETVLKERFEHNKGKLPYPVKSGYVTRKFGIQNHPTFKKIKINSTGIHIRCNKGDDARAVFSGKVLVVQLLSKGRKSVFIQHGNYITTYTNLENVYVKKGQKVQTGRPLGKIFTNKVDGKTTLQFVLSKNTKRLDPLKWLMK